MSGPFQYVPSNGFGQQVAAPLVHAVANQWAVGPTPPLTPSSSLHTSPINWDNPLPGYFDPQNPRILSESLIGPASTLSWPELLTLLQAGSNPRFSGTLTNARMQIIHGGNGDSLSLIGGFPYVVRAALPNARDMLRGQDVGTNATVEAALGQYINLPSAHSWNQLLQVLHVVAPTPNDQSWLAHSVFQALVFGFTKLLTVNRLYSPQVAMVAVMAAMGCQDRPNYGPLGKSGGRNLAPGLICPQIFLGANTSGVPQDSFKPGVLVSAFLAMAQAIVASRPL